MIPCYWESQPSGCLKAHCPFLHSKPRPQLPNVKERVSQFKFAAIDIKSLDQLRKETTKIVPISSTKSTPSVPISSSKSSPQQSYRQVSIAGDVVEKDQEKRKVICRDSNLAEFRFVTRLDNPLSQNEAPRLSRHFGHPNRTKEKGSPTATLPSFELGTVLKDVVSRLNSSSVSTTKSSSISTCAGDTTTTANSSPHIQPVTLGSLRPNIFSQANSEEAPGSIFSANFRRVSKRVPARESTISTSAESSNSSSILSGIGDVTMATQKQSRQLDVAKPESKRVGPVFSSITHRNDCLLGSGHSPITNMRMPPLIRLNDQS